MKRFPAALVALAITALGPFAQFSRADDYLTSLVIHSGPNGLDGLAGDVNFNQPAPAAEYYQISLAGATSNGAGSQTLVVPATGVESVQLVSVRSPVVSTVAVATGDAPPPPPPASPAVVLPPVAPSPSDAPPPALSAAKSGAASPAGQSCSGQCAGCPCPSDCDPGYFWTAGVEATFMWAHTSDAAAGFPGNHVLAATLFSDIQGQYDAAPRVWLGVENDCGWGIRTEYWRYSASDASYNIFVDPALNVTNGSGSASLSAYDIDLEVTKRFDYDCWNLLGSGGIRYGNLQREEQFNAYSTADDTFVSANSTRELHGFGLTSALEARRPLGDCGFGLVVMGRGSVLWGNNGAVADGEIGAPGGIAVTSISVQTNEKPTYIEEFQVGIDWRHGLDWFPGSCAFASLGFEYQHWDTPGELPFNYTQSVGAVHEFGRSLSSDVTFDGLAFSIGITR